MSINTLGKGKDIYQALKIYCDILWNKMLEIYIWQLMRKVLHRCFKISIFYSKTKSCLLHASEFPKICNYLVQEWKNFRQRAIYLSSVNKSIAICYSLGILDIVQLLADRRILPFCSQARIFESLIRWFEKFNLEADRKITLSLPLD